MVGTIIRLIGATVFPIIVAIGIFFLNKKTKFCKLSYIKQQVVIGVIFGAISVLATVFGIKVNVEELNTSATLNVRDASPLIAGLAFGGPAGIIAGLIGGIYRFFASYWGAGMYSQIACTVATIFSGIFAAGCRKFLFDNKKAPWIYGLLIGIFVEVLHMIILFLTHMDDIYFAFIIVKKCALPMIICNALSVSTTLYLISVLSNERVVKREERKQLSYVFQFSLLFSVLLAFFVTMLFTYNLETNIVKSDTEKLLELNISDVEQDVIDAVKSNDNIYEKIQLVVKNRHVGKDGSIVVCDSEFKIVSDSEHFGENVLEDGNKYEDAEIKEKEIFSSEIYGVENYCMYSIVDNHSDPNITDTYYVVASIPVASSMTSRDIATYIIAFMEVIVFSALFIHVFFLIKSKVVDNIDKINGSLAKITSGNLDEKVEVRNTTEFALLSEDINRTVVTLKHYISEAEARINKELEYARQIQKSVLPYNFNQISENKDFMVYATMNAAKEVGGDFYDYYSVGDDRFVFIVADVSGKGIPGAMFMMRSRTLIKSLIERGMDIDEAFTIANQKLCSNNETGMFVTAWMGELNYKTHKLSFVNAGHNPPLIKHDNGSFEYLKSKPNFVLAGMDGVKYRKNEMDVSRGDVIFVYTDGVTEATDTENELYGEERLKNILNENISMPPEGLCSEVKLDINKFIKGAMQFDDITMLCVKLDTINNSEIFVAHPDKNSISSAIKYVEDKMTNFNVDKKLSSKIQIAVDEIYSNIFRYSEANEARVSITKENNKLTLTLTDNGKPYDPTKNDDPDITLSAEDREIGGLGIFMVKKFASEVRYEYKDDKNILTIEFSL